MSCILIAECIVQKDLFLGDELGAAEVGNNVLLCNNESALLDAPV